MSESPNVSPAERGFRMPAEWQGHRATWVAWPHNVETWPHNLSQAQAEFVRLVRNVAQGETVCVTAGGQALQQARDALKAINNVEFFDIPTNDAWIRDYGPTFIVNRATSELAMVVWRYNGWGAKYPPFDDDVQVAGRIAKMLGARSVSSDLVVEGGALEINHSGDLLTTISCLLNPNRNPIPKLDNQPAEESFDEFQQYVSHQLSRLCGARSVTWLSGAELDGDDTDGHIDQQIRFLQDDLVLVARGYGRDDAQASGLDRNLVELRASFGRRLQGVDLPLPRPIEMHGRRIPASYLNFYCCNRGIIVPQFDDVVADLRAMEIFRSLVTDREVIGLPSRNLACGLGSFHCLTQQEPSI